MKKFEYKTESFGTPACTGMEKQLNKLGKEGWELVSVCPSDSYGNGLCMITAFLKREIPEKIQK